MRALELEKMLHEYAAKEGCTMQNALRDLITELHYVALDTGLNLDDAITGGAEVFLEETGRGIKQFKVAAVSRNANAFGLRGMVLMARDGESWQVGANSLNVRKQGAVIDVPLSDGQPNFSALSFEIPSRMTKPGPEVIEAVWE